MEVIAVMNLIKSLEYFNAREKVRAPIHIVGCGAIGSHVAEQLTRLGCSNIHLWDFDKVESKNIANQMFWDSDIGSSKVDAVEKMMKNINQDIKVIKHSKGITKPYILNGYIFLCVDKIGLRKAIVEANKNNPYAICFSDFRMRLTDAQYYFARREQRKEMDNMLVSMDFTSEEAKEATPTSACGTELSVIYTVKNIVTYGICNFVEFCLGDQVKNVILTDMKDMSVSAFSL